MQHLPSRDKNLEVVVHECEVAVVDEHIEGVPAVT